MRDLEGSCAPVLYIGRTVFNPYPTNVKNIMSF